MTRKNQSTQLIIPTSLLSADQFSYKIVLRSVKSEYNQISHEKIQLQEVKVQEILF